MLRQRVSRLARSALSFSKKLDDHIGAIKYFICHYNLTRATVWFQHYLVYTLNNYLLIMLCCFVRLAFKDPLTSSRDKSASKALERLDLSASATGSS